MRSLRPSPTRPFSKDPSFPYCIYFCLRPFQSTQSVALPWRQDHPSKGNAKFVGNVTKLGGTTST